MNASTPREILPRLFHWTAVHPKIRIEVSSYCWLGGEEGVAIDPLLPAGGVEWFREHGVPRHVVLSNRHHWRHSGELVREFGCTVWANVEGLHEFPEEDMRAFTAGDALPGGITSHPVGAICPDETALLVPAAEGALAVADGVVRDGTGPLTFVPDVLLGDDPEAVKRGLRAAYAALLELPFDHLLPAHGEPWLGGAKEALRHFCQADGE